MAHNQPSHNAPSHNAPSHNAPLHNGDSGAAPGPSYDAATTALLARMSSQPDATRAGHINTLIAALKTAGVWDKMDIFYVLAAHDAQAARLNWKAATFELTLTNAPTFTTDRGYAGDGATSYLDTTFNPATAGGVFANNDNHFAAWVQTDVASNTQSDIGNTTSNFISRRSTGNTVSSRSLSSTSNTSSATVGTSVGHLVVARAAGAGYERYKNGEAFDSVTQASSGLNSSAFFICAFNNAGAAAQFSTRRIAAMHAGSNITSGETSAAYTALAAYMTAVGA